MKLTKKQLKKLIHEAIYFPPGVTQKDIEFGNEMRKIMSPEDREKADILVRDFPDDLQGYHLGGVPEEKPEQPMKDFNIGDEQDLHKTPLGKGGGMKELVMDVDEEIYDYLTSKGSKDIKYEPDDAALPSEERSSDTFYALPMDAVYQEMRKYNIPTDLVDEVIQYYSYYGYERYLVDMGGRQVEFIKVMEH